MNIKQIIEGWRNKLIPPSHLKQAIEDVATLRLDICRNCEYNSINNRKDTLRWDEHCIDCGCPLSAKTRCLSCHCSISPPKWKSVITEDEEEEIREYKNGKEIQNSEDTAGGVVEHSGHPLE